MPFFKKLLHTSLVKKLVYAIVGFASYPGLTMVNKLRITGMENLKDLPKENVLFVSNHQTYFADVIAFLHVFCAKRFGFTSRLFHPFYLLWPYTHVNFIAAEETMKSSLLSRLFALAGAVSIKRTWRAEGKDVQRERDETDTQRIDKALAKNWVITFPQGTTKPFAPGRKGTAHIIKNNQPIVVPVVISGFWRAFDKKGLSFKKKGTNLHIRIKQPLKIDYTQSAEVILEQVMAAIEQNKEHMLKGKHHFVTLQESVFN